MQTVVQSVARFGHIATRRQLVRAGFTGTDLTRAVRSSEVFRVRQGFYRTREATADAVLATRVGGRLAGLSAARSYGLWSGRETTLHVAVAPNAARLRTNVPPGASTPLTPDVADREIELHWVQATAGRDCRRVPLPVCLRQVVSWVDRETAVACLDTAMQRLGMSTPQIRAIFASESPRSRFIAATAQPGSDSGTESLVRQRLAAVGISVHQQVTVPGVGRVDMLVSSSRVVIEVDGAEFHTSSAAFENDRRRDAELAARGYVVVRLSYRQVMFDWPWCERMILRTLAEFRS